MVYVRSFHRSSVLSFVDNCSLRGAAERRGRARLQLVTALVLLYGGGCASNDFGDPWLESPQAPNDVPELAADGSARGTQGSPDDPLEATARPGDGAARSSPQRSAATFSPAGPALPRLTRAQYRNTIDQLFGPGLSIPELEPDQRLYNFSVIGASQTTLSERGVELYSQAAFAIAKTVFADPGRRAALLPCKPASPLDEPCLDQYLRRFGRRVFRRPLNADELTRYKTLARSIGGDDPLRALQYLTAALLQSPNFLYRVELGEPDPDKPGWRRYSAYEMATRLSFLLRNSAPDATLLADAQSGALDTREGVVAAATRLLDDAEPTEQMISELFSEFFDLPMLEAVRFPQEMDPHGSLARSMQNEVLEIIKRVALREPQDLRALFTTRRFAPNRDLADLYGVTIDSSEPTATELSPESPRAGLLTTGGLLTLNNRPDRTSPTIRGRFVRQRLLCGTVPAPPPGIPPLSQQAGDGTQTLREQLERHRADPMCAGCHKAMDPIGLGMEDFDQFGRHRTLDVTGHAVDATGDLDGVMFTGARELGALLAKDPRVMNCMVTQLYRYASARLEEQSEAPLLQQVQEQFADNGYLLRPLLLALVGSDGFRYTVEAAP